jgi:superfamily II DNA or RNA helicase
MQSSIIDNQGENTLHNALQKITTSGYEFWIATAFFSLDSLNMMGERLDQCKNVRLLFGGDAAPTQRTKLLNAMRERSDVDLLKRRESDPSLAGLKFAKKLIEENRLQARVYTKDKFHAKAYLAHCDGYPELNGILGSGNFTRPGLTQNIELNVHLTKDQTGQLKEWFESVWGDATDDDISDRLFQEIERHVRLYNPRVIFLKALLDWGNWVRGLDISIPGHVVEKLDAHQLNAVKEGKRILNEFNALMVCDGVGLGKSYVALAIMEEALLRGEKVVLVAPKAIVEGSWMQLVKQYLRPYLRWGALQVCAMPEFQYAPLGNEIQEKELHLKFMDRGWNVRWTSRQSKVEDMNDLGEQVDLIIIDESHNFRTTGASRYQNALNLLALARKHRKARTVLLTATPVNTGYADITNQFRLMANTTGLVTRDDRSFLANIPLASLIKEANELDNKLREKRKSKEGDAKPVLQQPLDFVDDLEEIEAQKQESKILTMLRRIAIQRSRATCQQQAVDANKILRFPKRIGPLIHRYDLSPGYVDLIQRSEQEFTGLAKTLEQYIEAIAAARGTSKKHVDRRKINLPNDGLRFSGYLLDLYLKSPSSSKDESANLGDANAEAFLASLVFANVMKQLESSPAAYVSILRSLGASLAARLASVFPEDEKVAALVSEHSEWINRNVRKDAEPYEDDLEAIDTVAPIEDDEEPESLEAQLPSNETKRDRIRNQMNSRSLKRALENFGPETHNLTLWRSHIENDLKRLKDLHERALWTLQSQQDMKLIHMASKIKEFTDRGERVLVFTQSVLTAEYLQDHLPKHIEDKVIERVDGSVPGSAKAIRLHRFAPLYNQDPTSSTEPLPTIDVLIATDVLSEGVNLQQAGAIVNYDLHWNPTRLIQRVGRVDRRLRDEDDDREFSIVNCFPPSAIEKIIKLVHTVEGRVGAISEVTGIDQAFFKSEDEAGTLKEFNAMIDGTVDTRQVMLSSYEQVKSKSVELPQVDKEELDLALDIPDGAFGIWEGCGHDGLFGLFKIVLHEKSSPEEKEKYQHLVGRPILVLKLGEREETEPVKILHFLSATVPGQPSGTTLPADATMITMIKKLKQTALDTLEGSLPQCVTTALVVWLELRQ